MAERKSFIKRNIKKEITNLFFIFRTMNVLELFLAVFLFRLISLDNMENFLYSFLHLIRNQVFHRKELLFLQHGQLKFSFISFSNHIYQFSCKASMLIIFCDRKFSNIIRLCYNNASNNFILFVF